VAQAASPQAPSSRSKRISNRHISNNLSSSSSNNHSNNNLSSNNHSNNNLSSNNNSNFSKVIKKVILVPLSELYQRAPRSQNRKLRKALKNNGDLTCPSINLREVKIELPAPPARMFQLLEMRTWLRSSTIRTERI
jgi:hypothetical protein